MGWRNRPTFIDYLPNDISYIIFIDESGNASLKQIEQSRNKNIPVAQSEKNFAVTACVIKRSDYITLRDSVMSIKNKYWEDGLFEYNGQLKRVCFHSKEIREKHEAFLPDLIDYSQFIQDISELISSAPMTVFSSYIDKEQHFDKYHYPIPPYSLCMDFVIERIISNYGSDKSYYLIFEARGKKEDKALLDHLKALLAKGTRYCSPSQLKSIKGIYFNPKWCKMFDNKKSYWGLELADLCAYPIYKFCSYGTKDQAFNELEHKLYHYPRYNGYGIKKFP